MTVPTDAIYANWERKRAFEDLATSYEPALYLRCGDSAGTIALDRWGGNHGTHTGGVTLGVASSLAEDADTAVTLDGTDDYITVPDAASLDLADTFSYRLRVKRTRAATKEYLTQKGATGPGIFIDTDDKVYLEKTGTGNIVASTTTIADTAWHSILVTKSGAAARIYIDGIDVSGTVTNQTCASTAAALEFGRSSAPGNYFAGSLDELLVYADVITPSEESLLQTAVTKGEYGAAIDSIATYVDLTEAPLRRERGSNADYTGSKLGTLEFTLDNRTDQFSLGRNLAPNPSMESGLYGLETTAITSIGAAATDLLWVADPASGCGSYAGRASLSATLNSMIWFRVEGTFQASVPVTVAIPLKSISGNTSVEVGLASEGTPADLAASGSTITTSYATYSATLTPSAQRTDLVGFIRTRTAAAAVVSFDGIQVNIGSTANTYREAPTRPMLSPMTPIRWVSTHGGTDYGMFTGAVEVFDPRPEEFRVDVRCYDPLRTHDVPVDVTLNSTSAYAARYAVLDAAVRKVDPETAESLCVNGSFETDTSAWTLTGGAARSNSVTPPSAVGGSWTLEIPASGSATYNNAGTAVPFPTLRANRYYTVSWYDRGAGGGATLTVYYGIQGSTTTVIVSPANGTWTRRSYTFLVSSDTTQQTYQFLATVADVNIDGLMVSEGVTLPAYRDFTNPGGLRRLNRAGLWTDPAVSTLWSDGWSNRVSNPEAATNTTGWTADGTNATISQATSGSSNTDATSYTTASWTSNSGEVYYLVVHTTHGTSANTVTATGNGTWVSVATVQFASNTHRLTVLRSFGGNTSAATTINIGGGQTATSGAWSIWTLGAFDTTGTQGSGATVQSATGSAAASSVSVTVASALSSPFNALFVAMAHDAAGTATASGGSSIGSWTNGTSVTTNTPAGTTNVGYKLMADASVTASGGGSNTAAIIIEAKKGTTASTLTRVTAGGYAGGFSTAFENARTSANQGSYFALTGITFRSGKSYSVQVRADTLASGTWTLALRDLASDDAGSAAITGPITHGTGSLITASFTPTADRSNVVVYLSSGTATLTWSGVMVRRATGNYARTGFNSPSALTEANTITTVTDGVSYARCQEVVTYAIAGSGMSLQTTDTYAIAGGKYCTLVALKGTAGTESVAVGIGNPYGLVTGGDAATKTYTLSTSWQVYPVVWSAATTAFTSGDAVELFVMGTAASAITFRVSDTQALLGTAAQSYLPAQASGISTTESDVHPSASLVSSEAVSYLDTLNTAWLGRHVVTPTTTRPFWQLTTFPRRSLTSKAVAETIVSTTGNGIQDFQGFEQDAAAVYTVVRVSNLSGSDAIAYASADIRRRLGYREKQAGSSSLVAAPSSSNTDAQGIADLLKARYQVPRPRPRAVIKMHFPYMLQRTIDDLLVITYARQHIDRVRYVILSETLTVGVLDWEVMYELEEFVVA